MKPKKYKSVTGYLRGQSRNYGRVIFVAPQDDQLSAASPQMIFGGATMTASNTRTHDFDIRITQGLHCPVDTILHLRDLHGGRTS
jgi:hypothetical protein